VELEAQLLNGSCVVFVDCTDRRREIHGRDGLVERAVRFVEVLPPHRRAIAGQTLAEPQERALRRARRLVAELSIADPRLVHPFYELLCDDVHVQPLERETNVSSVTITALVLLTHTALSTRPASKLRLAERESSRGSRSRSWSRS